MSAERSRARPVFEHANQLWFFDGKTHSSLARYLDAIALEPHDPVLLYQAGMVLRAFGRRDEARRYFTEAARYRDRLSAFGVQLLDERIHQASGPSPFRAPVPVSESDLDIERLERLRLSSTQWAQIAHAAEEREMPGLALVSLQRGAPSFQDIDAARDVNEAVFKAEDGIALLEDMRAAADDRATPPRPAAATTTPAPLPAAAPVAQPALPPPPSPVRMRELQEIEVTLHVDPPESRIGAEVRLHVTLTNVSGSVVAVNRRLLVNHADVPDGYGEIVLQIDGPRGYQNAARFNVNAGVPGAEHFGLLSPGQSLRESIRLWKYETVHLPGRYLIRVVYRNPIARVVDGVPVLVGSASSHVASFRRTD